MIARIWQGVTPVKQADAYSDYLNETGLAGVQSAPGNRGAYVLRRLEGAEAHFMLISFWDSVESVKRFVGGDAALAHHLPLDKDFLVTLEPGVMNYEVLA